MSAVENKEVVRRFLREISAGGNLDLIDQLVAPNYTNRGLGNLDLAGFKKLIAGMQSASDVVIEDLVAEGDAVVVRSSMTVAVAGGEGVAVRAITFYRLAGGRIVEDDTLTTPDLSQILEGSAPVLARD